MKRHHPQTVSPRGEWRRPRASGLALTAALAIAAAAPALASSHMDAPLITFDDPANTTDVYAFVSEDPRTGVEYLTTALSVYPFEEPGIGPNNYRFDDRVTYDIRVALDDSIAAGRSDIIYRFNFTTRFENCQTILQNYLGPVGERRTNRGFFPNQNMRQSYSVTMIDRRDGGFEQTVLGRDRREGLVVPPNNQGLVTPFYNQGDNGDMPAKEGVTRRARLDPYTRFSIADLPGGYQAFAGQRDDGFYADIQSIFDLDFSFGTATGTPTKPFDSQGGFNVHTIVLNIPLSELNGAEMAGVYATTSRDGEVVGRQGNPLFAEALIAQQDKDLYNSTFALRDDRLFGKYVDDPELGRVFGVEELIPGLLRSIYIPDLIKVDLTTGPVPLAGQDDFHERSVFGGDVVQSMVQDPFDNGGFIPSGWPNGRRFGDDVIDIALIALGIAGTGPDFSAFPGDRVSENDITYHQVFPYAATPHNGRNHVGQTREAPGGL
jgi:hypothetical protein